MNDVAQHRLLIDASSPQATGLCPVLARILQAATPASFGFERITLITTDADATDWPQASWLEHRRTDGEDTSARALIEELIRTDPQTVLMSMNTARVEHERSVVFLSDAASSTFSRDAHGGGFLQRLKEKITARSELPVVEPASGIVALSCYAIAQTATLNKMQHLIPMGVIPDFFAPIRDHRLIEDVAIDKPFVWLTAADPASTAVDTAISAIKTLRDYGQCIELKVLLPAFDEAHERGEEYARSLEKKIRQLSFVELVPALEPPELAPHFHEADGFIWGDRSDYGHAPLLRAMASALPVVAPNAEMVKRHLGSKVRFFIHGDANDLANTLERSMADIHFRIIGSHRNHKRAMYYTFEKTAAELLRVLRAYAAAELGPVTEPSTEPETT